MGYKAKYFFPLRIYKKLSPTQIFNLMMCNKIMKSKALVAKSPYLYNLSVKLFSRKLTHFIINKTFCKALTAGNTL